MKTLTKEKQKSLTPSLALQLLHEGNKRFINNLKINRNLLEQAQETSDGQHPFAIILSCIDSRTSVELIFDQGLGDVFNVRIAGTIINDDILGSMEFACELAGAKIIVILGHTKCGAVKGACDNISLGSLTILLNKIQPAIQAESTTAQDRNSNNDSFVEKVTEIHVKKTVAAIMERSPILKKRITHGHCGIIGGNHDISSGKVQFYPDTKFGFFDAPSQSKTASEGPRSIRSKL